jgi:hypothetical protein
MPTRRIFDGATIEIGQVPIVGAALPPLGTIVWINVSGVWRAAILNNNVLATWKQDKTFIKVSGTWK